MTARILLTGLLALVAFGAWAVSTPITSGPDDDFHLTSIWCSPTADAALCSGDPADGVEVPYGITWPCFMHQTRESARCRTDDARIQPGSPLRLHVVRVNGYSQPDEVYDYPTIYYRTMGLLASSDVDRSAYLMRFANLALALLLLGALTALSAAGLRQSLLLTWGVLLVPTTIYLVTSNNSSAWSIIGVGTCWAALLALAMARERRPAIAAGTIAVLAALMAGARYDSPVYIVLTCATLLAFLRVRRSELPRAVPSAIVTAVCAAVSIAVYLGRGTVADTPGIGDATQAGGTSIFANLVNLPALLLGSFGSYPLGWLDAPMPGVVWIIGVMLLAAVLLHFLHWTPRLNIVMGAALLASVVAIVIVTEHGTGLTPIDWQLQPRYFLPLLFPALGWVLLSRSPEAAVPVSALQRWALVGGWSLAYALSLHALIRRYTTGLIPIGLDSDRMQTYWQSTTYDLIGLDLDQGVQWWYFPVTSPMATWFIGTVAFVALLVLLSPLMFPADGTAKRLR